MADVQNIPIIHLNIRDLEISHTVNDNVPSVIFLTTSFCVETGPI